MRRLDWAGWLVIASLGALSGCDPHAGAPDISGSHEEAIVRGTISVNGKPVNNGNVVWDCQNIRRKDVQPRQSSIDKDGKYEVKTLVGENFVNVSCKELFANPKMRMISNEIYTIKVPSGESIIDFDLPAGPKEPRK
jgi:hypothetical protein